MKSRRHGVKKLVTSMTRQCTRRYRGQRCRQEELKVLRTRWKDINKRDVEKPTSRSRVVAIESDGPTVRGHHTAGSFEVARVKRGYSGKMPRLRVQKGDQGHHGERRRHCIFRGFCCRRRLQSSCVKKTVEDQGAQWWSCCRNHCTAQERCSREFPEIQKFMKGQGFLLGEYKKN